MRRRFAGEILSAVLLASLFSTLLPAQTGSGGDLPALARVSSEEAILWEDDADRDGFLEAVRSSRDYYRQLPSGTSFYFGTEVYFSQDLAEGLERILAAGSEGFPDSLRRLLSEEFDVYRARGPEPAGTILFSSYHEPTLKASRVRTNRARFPLYGRPADLVDVPLENFDPERRGERWVGRLEKGALVPYYTREEIDIQGKLAGRGLELAWAESLLDVLFLQIQGSGWIQFEGEPRPLHIRYAGDNGRPYRSVGLYLIESGAIPKDQFNRARMVAWMDRQSEERQKSILSHNPRYIFFEITDADDRTRGSLKVPLTAGRSIATDPRFYPPGALAWIRVPRPVFDRKGEVRGKVPMSRFVLNQDEGGAIKGPGRMDFFAGGGKEAELLAQKLWDAGELYFFAKRKARP